MAHLRRGCMCALLLSALIVLSWTHQCSASLFGPSSPVKMLTPNEFQRVVKISGERWLIIFTEDNSVPTKKLAAQFERVAQRVGERLNFGAIDGSDRVRGGALLTISEGVRSLPTLRVYLGSGFQPVDFKGNPDVQSIVAFLKAVPARKPQGDRKPKKEGEKEKQEKEKEKKRKGKKDEKKKEKKDEKKKEEKEGKKGEKEEEKKDEREEEEKEEKEKEEKEKEKKEKEEKEKEKKEKEEKEKEEEKRKKKRKSEEKEKKKGRKTKGQKDEEESDKKSEKESTEDKPAPSDSETPAQPDAKIPPKPAKPGAKDSSSGCQVYITLTEGLLTLILLMMSF